MDISWTTLVLITKGNADTRGEGVIEILWKLVEAIIDTRINILVMFHDTLHVFCASRGTGTDIVDLNMAQDLTSIFRDPLSLVFLVFLYLRTSYDTFYRGQLLQTLEKYRAIPKV